MWLKHIRIIHADSLRFKISCQLQGCKRTFNKFLTFQNRVYSAHDPSAVVDVGVLSESEAENTDEQTPSDTEQDLSTASEGSCTCKY